ncbi:MAG: histidinol dehydrogenase [Lysobacterales bacterium]
MPRFDWSRLDASQRRAVLARPARSGGAELSAQVARIIAQVRADGDTCLRALTRRYDGVELGELAVPIEQIRAAGAELSPALRDAMTQARARLLQFHAATQVDPAAIDTAPGLVCERLPRPIQRVGLYVPAGSAPLPSTALMLGVPAQLARCPEVILCTPPRPDGRADPAVLHAAALCGIERVFLVGGAQAIAAMAFGTDSIPACDKLFGPGNGWVEEAKRQVSMSEQGPAIDLHAGPSEVLVIADAQADPAFVAADLLAQAEHGPDSQVLLITPDPTLIDAVEGQLQQQLASLPRADIARQALEASRALQVPDLASAVVVSNAYAPEHLILQTRQPRALLPSVSAAGSVFLGAWTPESLGDYGSGTNHVLPTGGAARYTGGVSVASFQKLMTVQEATPAGLAAVGPDTVTLAEAEGLRAHAQAVSVRLAALASST